MTYEDYYENTSAFDEEMEALKEHLRKSVKEETRQKLDKLRTENREMAGKLANLDRLQREAENAKCQYERKLNNATFEAETKLRKEKLRDLLATLDETRYKVSAAWDSRPKCDKCDDERRLVYLTPRGKEVFERCECADTDLRYEVETCYVHEVSRRSGKMLVWWEPEKRRWSDDDDTLSSATVLESPEGVPLVDRVKNYTRYGYATAEAAQEVVDAKNAAAPVKEPWA